jgi:hypothetical protein
MIHFHLRRLRLQESLGGEQTRLRLAQNISGNLGTLYFNIHVQSPTRVSREKFDSKQEISWDGIPQDGVGCWPRSGWPASQPKPTI